MRTDFDANQEQNLFNLYNEYTYLGKSHLKPEKQQSRNKFLFKNFSTSNLITNTIKSITLIYLSKILTTLQRKISDSEFKSILMVSLFLSQHQHGTTNISLEEISEEFHLFAHYVIQEDLKKWCKNCLLILNFDLSLDKKDFVSSQNKKTGR